MLALTAVSVFLVSLDLSIVVVAKRSIADDLGGGSLLTWVFSAYAIAYAAALLTAGRFADVFGRKRSFLRGVLWFSLGSLLCGVAPSAWFLVVARIVQAFGGAQLSPASLAIVLPEFPVEKRTQAIAIWGATGGIAAALGPSIGGVFVDWLGWRSLFFLNIPFTLATVVIGRRLLRESKDPNAQRKVDYPSAMLGFSGVALVVLGISQSEVWGWLDPGTLIALVAGIALCGAFISRCRHAANPILDLNLFRLRFVVAANVAGVLFSMGFIGMWLLNTFWLQAVWGYSVAISGLSTMPGPTTAAFIAPFAGKYADRFGHSRVLFAGSLLLAFGTFAQRHDHRHTVVPHALLAVDDHHWCGRRPQHLHALEFGDGLLEARAIGDGICAQQHVPPSRHRARRRALAGHRRPDVGASRVRATRRRIGARRVEGGAARRWLMNAFIYLAAGIAMIAIFKRPTDSQMEAARGA